MSRLDTEAHRQVNAALRQMLADSMPDASGGIVAIRDLPDRFQALHMGDLTATLRENRMAGLDLLDALAALVAEVRADVHRQADPNLIGIGLIGHAFMGPNGNVASLLATVDGVSHQIMWPHSKAQPTWEIKAMAEVGDEDCAAYLVAAQNLIEALAGQG